MSTRMNKAMREIMAELEQTNKAARAESDPQKQAELIAKGKKLAAQYETEQAMFENETAFNEANGGEQLEKGKPADGGVPKTDDARTVFLKAARDHFPVNKSITNETSAEAGGYTVPVDIVTKVERFRDAHTRLLPFVRTIKVNTESGARTFLSRHTHTGFSEVSEGGAIGKKGGPAFQRLTYTVKKYAGYNAATNEVLADSDENIEAYLTEWLGEEAAKTYDTEILATIATKNAVALDGVDGIKHEVNVTLGQAFAATSRIITNDDGLNWLDTLKDGNDRYLLSPDPANPMQMRLAVGARFIPLTVVPNADLPSEEVKTTVEGVETVTGYKYPFILGDLNEGIICFDRASLSVKASDTAVVGSGDDLLNAYEQDLTLLRGIIRMVVKVRDAAAFVNGYIQVSAS